MIKIRCVKGANISEFLVTGMLGVLLFTCAGGYGLAQEAEQDQADQEPNEAAQEQSQEKPSLFQKVLDEVGKDIATSEALIQVAPRIGGQAGQLPVSSNKGPYDRGEWFVAPVPVSNPTLGSGLAGGAGYIYRFDPVDDVSPPTITGVGGMYTSNESWALAGMHDMAWKRDRFRLNAMGGFGNINMDFSGKGSIPGEDETRISVNIRGAFVETDFVGRIFERVFVGPRFNGFFSETRPTDSGQMIPPDFPDLALDIKTISLGFKVMRDTRDSAFYPRSGSWADFTAAFYRKGIGSDFNYEKYMASLNVYQSLTPHQVIAARVSTCGVNGDTPFFDICFLGQEADLRGYRLGAFQDERMLAAQVEYRLDLFWRFGVVGFAGVGQVAAGYDQFKKGNWLPGAGFGFRILVAKENHVNLRVDFAWGRAGNTATYVNGAEAF
jgi:hypothetical protein